MREDSKRPGSSATPAGVVPAGRDADETQALRERISALCAASVRIGASLDLETDDRSHASRSDDATIERAKVRIDRKGRLSVDVVELAASKTFRTELSEMVELARTHPPKTSTS